VWLGSRAALIGLVLLGGYLLGTPPARRIHGTGAWVLERFVWWDSFHFLRIVEQGYPPPGQPCCDQAFFPGYPLAVRAASLLTGGRTQWAALLVSLVAGAVAAVLIWRLATERAAATGHPQPARAGMTAVGFLSVAPYGIFLSAAYSESIFLAFALGAWWAGGRRRWWLAGLLLAGATAIRMNGAFLTAGLAVMYLIQLRSRRWRPRPDVLALLAPVLVIAGFFGYLYRRTGSWSAWQKAEELGWHRQNAWPWQGIAHGWRYLLRANAPDLVVSRAADLGSVLLGLVFVLVLLALRRWPEAVYLGLSVGVVVCSTVLISSPRYALSWFPVFLLVTDLVERPRWRWLRPVLLIGCLPLAALVALSFSAHQWVA
jgi:hypothetical protein